MNQFAGIAVIVALAVTGACKRVDGVKVDDATMTKVSDEFLAAATAGDVTRDDALYAKDAVAVDPVSSDLIVGSEAMHKSNQAFIDMKIDKVVYTERKFVALDENAFVVIGKVHAESSAGPAKSMDFRVTDVFRKQDDGKFLIVHEHTSLAPSTQK